MRAAWISELLALQWRDLDLTTGRLLIRRQLPHDMSLPFVEFTKGRGRDQSREIIVPKTVLAELEAHRKWAITQHMADVGGAMADDTLLFVSTTGTPMDRNNWAKQLQKRADRAQLGRVTPHMLRHTAASMLLNASPPVPMELVSKMLGHASVRFTVDLYSHLLSGGRQTLADAIDAMASR